MKFRVGQMVRIVRGPAEMIGTVHQIVSLWGLASKMWESFGVPEGTPVVKLDSMSRFGQGQCGYPPEYLEPLHDPSDFATLAELLRAVRGETEKEDA